MIPHYRTLTTALALTLALPAFAEPTQITVRVMSRDAKFIGTSMGGVEVTLSDADSGTELAKGIIEGGTGSTPKLVVEPRVRGQAVSTDDAAKFETTLDLDQPRRIQVTARGPLNFPDAANTVSATQWVVPGKHLTGGDGWVLEMPGFVVSFNEAPSVSDGRVTLNVHMSPMCGCPVEPDGLWNANGYEVQAVLSHDGTTVTTLPLTYAGKTGDFTGSAALHGAGIYEALVYAHDPVTGNTGVTWAQFRVER